MRKRKHRDASKCCQWIAGKPDWRRRGDAIYCGAVRKQGSSYCCEHHVRVWHPLKRGVSQAKPTRPGLRFAMGYV